MSTQSLSRRDTLKLAGAAGITLILDRTLRAQQGPAGHPADGDPFVFALITDTHLGRTAELDVEKFKAAVNEINKTPAELVICCGDLVNDGQVKAHEPRYDQWVEIAKSLKAPWHAVPGNHDPVDVFKKHIRPETDFTVDRAPFRFICFADARLNPHHDGAVTPEQIQWIDQELGKAERDNRKAILIAHVTFHKNDKPDRGWYIETGRDDLSKVLEKHARTIAAFFTGHHHVGLRGWNDNWSIPEVVLPSNTWNSDEGIRHPKDGYWEPDLREGWTLATVTGDHIQLNVHPVGVPGPGIVRKLT